MAVRSRRVLLTIPLLGLGLAALGPASAQEQGRWVDPTDEAAPRPAPPAVEAPTPAPPIASPQAAPSPAPSVQSAEPRPDVAPAAPRRETAEAQGLRQEA